jgi:hypothetical protein
MYGYFMAANAYWTFWAKVLEHVEPEPPAAKPMLVEIRDRLIGVRGLRGIAHRLSA